MMLVLLVSMIDIRVLAALKERERQQAYRSVRLADEPPSLSAKLANVLHSLPCLATPYGSISAV
jgi:hypothetical protein